MANMGAIPKGDRDLFFKRFKVIFLFPLKILIFSIWTEDIIVLQRKVTWRVKDEEKVKKNFHSKASHTLSQMFKVTRQKGKRLEWIGNSILE